MTSTPPKKEEKFASCFFKENVSNRSSEILSPHDFEWTDEVIRLYELSFLHDLLNSAGGLRGYLELLHEINDPDHLKKYVSNSLILCDSLINEVEYHREFLLAKNGNFKPVLSDTNANEILQLTVLILSHHSVSKGCKIELSRDCAETIETDKVLLSRLLVNMTKNAVEATEDGGVVSIGACKLKDKIRFAVHNSAAISEKTQNLLFKSHFSTKGNNRGIGLFSIKLIGEKLGGQVGFDSNEEEGTCFFIDLPLQSKD